jgi:predicted CoA-binding protein
VSTLERIQEFLGQKRLAVVGVSKNEKDFSRTLFREFQKRGYDVVAVNPGAREIEGRQCFASVREVQPPVVNALLMTAPVVTETVVRDCANSGVQRVWMYRAGGKGAVSAEAVRFCEANGITVIPGECPMMFLPQSGFIHSIHAVVKRMVGSYPR